MSLPTRRQAIIGLTFGVAVAAGYESWQAAAKAAETGGRPHPYLWPVTLEAFIAVLVLVYWEARSEGRTAGWARLLLWTTTLLASSVQVLDVFAGDMTAEKLTLGVVTAAWTPIALNLTVEFATWLLYGGKERAAEAVREAVPAASVRAAQPLPPKAASRATPAPRPKTNGAVDPAARAAIAELAAGGGERVVIAGLRERGLDVSRAALRRELAQLRNGDGREVAVQ